MRFVGIDLAWAGRNHSGLAVLDGDGRLEFLGAAHSDDEIVEALTEWDADHLVVAFDAPIVVGNAAGARHAERKLNADFASFQAGAHPSNTGKPEFAGGDTRARRIADRLDLTVAPIDAVTRSSARRPLRCAVEVYPHPATVALFRLGRTLKYKQKPGRSLIDLQSGLMQLVGLIEDLDQADPPLLVRGQEPWVKTAARIRATTTKRALRPAEDEIDAVLCAYVALLAAQQPDRLTAYGTDDAGYILTPTLPPDLRPSAPLTEATHPTPDTAVDEYAARHPVLVDATRAFADLVTARLDDTGINYLSVTSRTKSVESFTAKAVRTRDGALLYQDPLTEITDQIGLRVITYLQEDVAAVADQLADQFVVLDDRDLGQETASQGVFGYASRHLLVEVDPDDEAPAILRGRRASIQIRTVLQHAWAEFEHDIRYKGTIPDQFASDLDRRFTLAAALLELADREFSAIRDRLQQTMGEPSTSADPERPTITPPPIGAADLAALLAERFTDAGWSRADHYEWMSGLLLELGITSASAVAGVLDSVDTSEIDARMGYRHPPGAVRRLDDALLDRHSDAYLQLRGNAHRQQALRSRLERLRAGEPPG